MTLGSANGHRDIEAGGRQTAFAKFAAHYDRLKKEHCTDDANRQREYERALQILERTCDCRNEKIAMPDGSLGDSCRQRYGSLYMHPMDGDLGTNYSDIDLGGSATGPGTICSFDDVRAYVA